jgi:proliferating cell nuclear antigen
MFKASFADAKIWKNLLTAISRLIEESDFEITPDAMRLRSMDPSHVAMVDFELQNSAFESYSCTAPLKIRVNMNSMLKLLRRVGSDEHLEIVYDEGTKKIEMTLKGKMMRRFTMPTLEPAEEEVPTPKLTFNTRVKMIAGSFRDMIEDSQAISDNVKFESNVQKFVVNASGELSTATIELEKGSEALLDLEVKEPSKATFNLNYLAEIIKAGSTASEVVTVEYSTNMPVRIQFEMPQQGRLQYYLAPRIEAE